MKTIMDMALNAGFSDREIIRAVDRLVAFAALVAAAEREACAAMFDDRNVWDEEVGERIRARGQA